MPYHKLLDHAGEAQLGKLQIGTTRRGIGPCYADKAARLGIRMQDLLDEKILRKKIYTALEPKRLMLRPFAKDPELDLHTMSEEYRILGHRLEPYIADTPPIAWRVLEQDGLVVFEGAQGALLDIDHGTYPFVTSSNTVAGAACAGAGSRTALDRRGLGDREGLHHAGGRRAIPDRAGRQPRRAHPRGGRRVRHHHRPAAPYRVARPGRAALRHSHQRADRARADQARRADRHRPAHVGVRYLGPEGATFDEFPYHQSIVHKVTGDLVELPGWHEDISGVRSIEDLPANAQAYLEFISDFLGIPVVLIGVGGGARRDDLDQLGRAGAPGRRLTQCTTWVDTTMSCRQRFSPSQSGHR